MGIASIQVELPASVSAAELHDKIAELNADPACTGYLIQLPLPGSLDEFAALLAVDPDKDVDGLHPVNLGRLVLGAPGPLPCTPRGIVELLRRNGIPLAGADVCVIGRGTTVGRPLGLLLTRKSENATVTLCHTGTKDLVRHTREANIVVAAAGRPGLVTADMVRPGAVCVDVGITRTEQGLVGDVDASVHEVASWVAPVPGGVGPMTRAMLLTNVVERAEQLASHDRVCLSRCALRGPELRPVSLVRHDSGRRKIHVAAEFAPHSREAPLMTEARRAKTEPTAAARTLRAWPLLIVLLGVVAGLVIALVGESSWRVGCLVIGGSLGVGAVERIALPSREAGLLQVRGKAFDAGMLIVLGATIIALAVLVPRGD